MIEQYFALKGEQARVLGLGAGTRWFGVLAQDDNSDPCTFVTEDEGTFSAVMLAVESDTTTAPAGLASVPSAYLMEVGTTRTDDPKPLPKMTVKPDQTPH